MKVGQNFFEDSKDSLLSVDKDLSLIVKKMMENDKLMKLIYYTQKDCLRAENLTQEQKYSMINKNILLVPKIDIDTKCPCYVIVGIGDFEPNQTNPEFLDCEISFDILCHEDHWNLGNFALRPYKIAGEINRMFNKTRLTGIGVLQFMGTDDLVMPTGSLMGISVRYKAIHGIEDQIDPLS